MVDFDNQLVRQKNKIIELINDNKIEQAKAALEVVAEMWEANKYGYKVKELNERIADKVANSRATKALHRKEMLEAYKISKHKIAKFMDNNAPPQ